jgi:acyl transferase domain-containing protein/phosphopantetheinyl transferase
MSAKRKDTNSNADVAIVGMGCVFPKAPDLNTYWHNIVTKVDAISDPPADRLIDDVYDPEANANDRIYCRRGGYIDDLATFNPLKYGIMPVGVEGAEPEHFLALKVADAALTDAGFPDLPFNRERFDTIVGRGTFVNSGYVNLLQHGFIVDQTLDLLKDLQPQLSKGDLAELKQALKSSLPPFTAETAPGLASSVMTGIIANRMDLGGRNFTVDAACASALIALENGIQNLLTDRCDAVLVGAVQISTPPVIHMLFTQLGALSRHPQLRPFDTEADGTMLGEGIGMMVIKRLDDAIRDGHRIYAVVKGVGSSSDGQAKGLLAPSSAGQELAMSRAYQYAGVEPSTVGLIETHGTGIPLGDATEINSMTQIFGARRGKEASCAIGTIKSMIGHLIPAAGIAGLIKTSLAIYHRTLPPSLNCEQPHSQLGLENTPFYVNTEPRPWVHGIDGNPRRASVNAFGFGGINTHAVLEEYLGDSAALSNLNRSRESELFLVTGADREQLVESCQVLSRYVENHPEVALVDLAYTLWQQNKGPARLALVASDTESLLKKLTTAIKRLQEPGRNQIKDRGGMFYFEDQLAADGSVAFIFPGEGSQYVNMLRDLCLDFPEVRNCFDVLDRAFKDHVRGFVPSDFIFPKLNSDLAAAEARIWSMDGAVDSVITADRAMFRLLHSLGIDPDVILGHSSGEIMALEAAGAIVINDDEELVGHIRSGNRMIEKLGETDNIPEAQLIAVGGVERDVIDTVVDASDGALCVAMENCPHQFVICSANDVANQTIKELTRLGGVCQPLEFSRAYHTTHFEPALQPLKQFFDSLPVESPRVPMYSCLTAERVPDDVAEIRRLAVLQWARPVLFRQTIENMYRDGVRIFIEVGPRSNLTGFVNDILNGKEALAISCNNHRRSGITQLHHLLGHLYASGVDMQLNRLYQPRQAQVLDITADATSGDSLRKEIALRLGMPRMTLGKNKAEILQRLAGRTAPLMTGGNGAESQPAQIVSLTAAADKIQAVESHSGSMAASFALGGSVGQGGTRLDDVLMNQYLDTMDTFLEVQQQTMRAYLDSCPEQGENDHGLTPQANPAVPAVSSNGNGTGQPGAQITANLTRVTTLQQPVPDEAIVAQRSLSLDRDPFLSHHTLGGKISHSEPELVALPVLPLSMALEFMAELAASLFPDQKLTCIQAVRMFNWITLQDHNLDIETTAKTEKDWALVQLSVISPGSEPEKSLAVEGRFKFADAYPGSTAASPRQLGEESAVSITAAQIYPQALFHGPAFRAITSIDSIGSGGIVTRLKVPQLQLLAGANSERRLLTEPVLVDAIGQSVGLWTAGNFDSNIVAFPVALDEIQFFGPAAGESAELDCQLQTTASAEQPLLLESNAELIGTDGQVHIRVRGLQHRRVLMPILFHQYRGSRSVRLTSSWEAIKNKFSNGSVIHCCRTDKIETKFWNSEDGIWCSVLAFIILSASERLVWLGLGGPEHRKTEWLLGRLAAKEAVCQFLRDQHDIELWPADIEIGTDEHGKPVVSGDWVNADCAAPLISISHSNGMAAAVAASANKSGVGFDIEYRRVLSQDLAQGMMQTQEKALFDEIDDEDLDSWKLRLWCAKEALGKALGRGLMGAPKNLVAQRLDLQNGTVYLVLTGSHLKIFPELAAVILPVHTLQEGDFIAACGLYENQ